MSSENIGDGTQSTQLIRKADQEPRKDQHHSTIDPAAAVDSEDTLGKSILDDLDKDALPGSRKRSIWDGWNGSFVMVFGVCLPLMTILLGCASCPKRLTLVALNHPIETIAELFLLIAVPVINYRVWSALCEDTVRFSPFPRARATYLGLALGTSLVTCAISVAGLIIGSRWLTSELGTTFDTGFFLIASLS